MSDEDVREAEIEPKTPEYNERSQNSFAPLQLDETESQLEESIYESASKDASPAATMRNEKKAKEVDTPDPVARILPTDEERLRMDGERHIKIPRFGKKLSGIMMAENPMKAAALAWMHSSSQSH